MGTAILAAIMLNVSGFIAGYSAVTLIINSNLPLLQAVNYISIFITATWVYGIEFEAGDPEILLVITPPLFTVMALLLINFSN